MKKINWIAWGSLLVLFATDFFIVSEEATKLTSCAFWAVLILFNMWRMMIEKTKRL